MSSIAYPLPHPMPVPVTHECPAGCPLAETILCWRRYEREVRSDLAAARGCDDADVLRADLAAAERQIDALIAFGRWAA